MIEEQMKEHLNGFPARQKEMIERFDSLESKLEVVRTHTEPSPKTTARLEDLDSKVTKVSTDMLEVKRLNVEWTKLNDERHSENVKKLEGIRSDLSDLIPIVKEKLLPAYEREMKDEMLLIWLKEKAKSVSFWITIISTIGGFFWGLLYVIKQFTKD